MVGFSLLVLYSQLIGQFISEHYFRFDVAIWQSPKNARIYIQKVIGLFIFNLLCLLTMQNDLDSEAEGARCLLRHTRTIYGRAHRQLYRSNQSLSNDLPCGPHVRLRSEWNINVILVHHRLSFTDKPFAILHIFVLLVSSTGT